ncbi:hypothetical protein ANN_17963 [Periplaneta americana]|uniref:Uncharacterized protein n=1 Tax=Periplaneta americana TaxID=6978 RepID=A0ABQ8SNN4_PERAM|nr:hypothetical protein ANN_17963 [Periplaneta americana]
MSNVSSATTRNRTQDCQLGAECSYHLSYAYTRSTVPVELFSPDDTEEESSAGSGSGLGIAQMVLYHREANEVMLVSGQCVSRTSTLKLEGLFDFSVQNSADVDAFIVLENFCYEASVFFSCTEDNGRKGANEVVSFLNHFVTGIMDNKADILKIFVIHVQARARIILF